MATSAEVQLIFDAIDRASATMSKIESRLASMGSQGEKTNKVMDGIFQGVGQEIFRKGMDLATQAVGFFVDKMTEAGERQQQAIGSTGALAVAMGKPFKDAVPIIDSLTTAIQQNFAALPGATQAYVELGQALITDLVPAAKDFTGALSVDKLQKITMEMTKIYELIGTAQGASTANITQGLRKALGGQVSISELKQDQLFQSGLGAQVLKEIQAQVLKAGAKDLKELSDSARIGIILAAGQKFITTDMVEAYKRSFQGAVENINTMIFDMTDFGAKITSRSGQTVIKAAGKAIDATMKLFSTIASILGLNDKQAMLAVIYDGLTAFTNFIEFVNNVFTTMKTQIGDKLTSLRGALNLSSLGAIFDAFYQIGFILGQAVGDWIATVDWAKLIVDIGNAIVIMLVAISGLVTGATQGALPGIGATYQGLVDNIAYGFVGMGMSVGELWTSVISQITSITSTAIAGIGAMVVNAWNGIVTAATNFVNGLATSIASAINSIDLAGLASRLAALVKANVESLVGANTSSTGGMGVGGTSMNAYSPAMMPAYVGIPSMATVSSNFAPQNYINISNTSGSPYDISDAIVKALDKQWNIYRASYNI